ncbi:MAG: manganese efflux pump [Planctomycetota bacterium]
MPWTSWLLLPIGTSADAFAIAATLSVAFGGKKEVTATCVGFGMAAFAMTFVGAGASEMVTCGRIETSRLLSVLILIVLGLRGLRSGLTSDGKTNNQKCPNAIAAAILASSIDCSVVGAGVSSELGLVLGNALLLGTAAALASAMGAWVGVRASSKLTEKTECVGGVSLIAFALLTLILTP